MNQNASVAIPDIGACQRKRGRSPRTTTPEDNSDEREQRSGSKDPEQQRIVVWKVMELSENNGRNGKHRGSGRKNKTDHG